MPFTAALAGVIASIVGAGVGAGSAVYQDVSKPGQPQQPPPLTAAQNIANETQARSQKANLVNQVIPNEVSQTSGGLSDQAYQTFGSQDAGIPGAFGQGGLNLDNIMSFLGGGPNSGLANNQNPTDLMSLASGGITG